MKFYLQLSIFVLLASCVAACTGKKEQGTNQYSDSITTLANATPSNIAFAGEYLIGDGGTFIVPVGGTYEMRNERGEVSNLLFFQGKEKDTLSVYESKDKSIIFKMNPDHKFGMYYERDEQWPVSFLKPIVKEETEEEETKRIMTQRHDEDSVAYTQLGMYDGTYFIETESEGVNATLTLKYKSDQTFAYGWNFEVGNEEINCKGKRKGILAMDRTQHGIDVKNGCPMHFNFNGYYEKGYVVEIDFEDQSKCPDLIGECTFSGTYVKK